MGRATALPKCELVCLGRYLHEAKEVVAVGLEAAVANAEKVAKTASHMIISE
jgi:3-deoxy-D-manno-octulosonate 8-phosphate phosphatase KdsC-like HAD superfamily phosphatase